MNNYTGTKLSGHVEQVCRFIAFEVYRVTKARAIVM